MSLGFLFFLHMNKITTDMHIIYTTIEEQCILEKNNAKNMRGQNSYSREGLLSRDHKKLCLLCTQFNRSE
jgi:hypothetical protein